jgi:hypothetical protein
VYLRAGRGTDSYLCPSAGRSYCGTVCPLRLTESFF